MERGGGHVCVGVEACMCVYTHDIIVCIRMIIVASAYV